MKKKISRSLFSNLRSLWVLLFLAAFYDASIAQPTFSKRLHFGFPAAVLTSVVPTDSGYLANGLIADSIPPFNTSNIFSFFNLEGELEWAKTLRDTSQTYEFWRGNLTQTSEGDFLSVGYTYDPYMQALFMKRDSNGDTLAVHQYDSFFHPELDFISPKDFVQTDGQERLILTWTENPEGVNNGDLSLLFIDSLGQTIWHRPYGQMNRNEVPFSLSKTSNGKFIVGGVRNNMNVVNENYTSRTWIFQTDSLGNIEWEYLSPSSRLERGATDICMAPDGGLVVASAVGTEVDRPSVNSIAWDLYIFKLAPDLSFCWDTYFRPVATHPVNRFNKMVVASDGSGYLAAGKVERPNFEEGGWDINGFLAKVSPEGDSLWSRQLNIVESPGDEHEFIDIRETPDGGFILVGEALDFTQSPQAQQAWIIKVDEWGCLVPGCHLISSSEEAEQVLEKLRLYPNPARDYLNVFVPPGPAGGYELRILNAQGQVMKQYRFDQTDITHLLPVYDLPGGTYWLQVVRKGGWIDSRGFVVGK